MNFIKRMLLPLCIITSPAHAYLSDGWHDFKKVGDIGRYAIPAAGLVFTGLHQDWEGAQQLAISIVAVQASTELLKYTVRQRRPTGESRMSFPSGHTSAAFTGAAFVHRRYGFKPSIPLYIGATAVAASRVYVRSHYTHDVIAGAALGIGITWFLTEPFSEHGMQVAPIIGEQVGVSISKKFS